MKIKINQDEYDILRSVAKAAKQLSNLHDEAFFICGKDDEPKVNSVLLELNSCLAALETIQDKD